MALEPVVKSDFVVALEPAVTTDLTAVQPFPGLFPKTAPRDVAEIAHLGLCLNGPPALYLGSR